MSNGDEFMAEMAAFLRPGGAVPEGETKSSKLKLKKEKKSKKEKKAKKEKKKKRDKDGKEDEPQWVDSAEVEKPKTESWLGIDENVFATIGGGDHRKEKEQKRREAELAKEEKQNELGQHSRELNPFWKNGGTGLPPTESELRVKEETAKRERERVRMRAELANDAPKVVKPFIGDVKVERNKLMGKLMRAELKKDTKRVAELKARLASLPDESVTVTVAKVDQSGRVRPEHRGGARKAQEDDIAALVRAEREDTGDAMRVSEAALMKAAAKNFTRGGGLDELFEGTAAKRARREKIGDQDAKDRQRSQKIHRTLANCRFCYDNGKMTSSIAAVGETVYIAVTGSVPMTEGHCLLITKNHFASLPTVDEDVAAEILNWRRKLTSMWKLEDKEPVFITTSTRLRGMPHFLTECVPIDLEEAEFAPMYFQKAFQDAEGLWATNKAVINTMKEQSHYKKVPPQLGHIAVEFGGGGGFAHIVENGERFPPYFMREIIGGLLDLPPAKWRKPEQDEEAEIIYRAEELEKKIKDFERTNPTA